MHHAAARLLPTTSAQPRVPAGGGARTNRDHKRQHLGAPTPRPRSQRPRAEPRDAAGSSSSSNSIGAAPSPSTSSTPSQPGVPQLLDPAAFTQELLQELGDPSQRGQRGEAWTVAQFVALALVLLPPFHATELTNVVGVLLLLGGLGAIAVALTNLGAALTPLPAPRANSQLVTTGVYAYMRHPMYGGLLLSSLGLAAVTHDEARLLAAAFLWLVLEQKVAFEERLLTERYGQAYSDYKASVNKFIPFLY